MNVLHLTILAALSWATQDPKELQSPHTGSGDAAGFFASLTEESLQKEETRHAALLLLQGAKETKAYLGTVLARGLRAEIRRLLAADLRTAAWADIA